MIVAGKYYFNGGDKIESLFPSQCEEIFEAISRIKAENHRTKESEEKTMQGKMLFSPKSLNGAFKELLIPNGWESPRITCEYSTSFYVEGYKPKPLRKGAFREMDFVKDKIGIEIQFGKYSFMVYNVCAKMTIFHRKGYINYGIEVVPVKSFADNMSTGVSYFEQFVWDLENRGFADIDIPVCVLGIDSVKKD